MSKQTGPTLHQAVEAILPGDATSAHVLLIRRWLRELGFDSDIYAALYDETNPHDVKPFAAAALADQELVIFHHAMGSDMLDQMARREIPLLFIYHNITPPQFFSALDIRLAQQLMRGRRQLEEIRPLTRLALSDSDYSEAELRALGFSPTGVLPIVLDEPQYALPSDESLAAECRAAGPLLLFVGRVAPNKRQEDLIKLLHYYRRLEPQAHLVLVGGHPEPAYLDWLRRFTAELGLEEAVTFTGHVTQQEMVTYYREADIFVSMSEHEGFGKPLIESMYFDLPVLAYRATAVPSTLGAAGVLFLRKEFEALAELVAMIVQEGPIRRQLITGQQERVQEFLEPQVRRRWTDHLATLGLLPQAQSLPSSGVKNG